MTLEKHQKEGVVSILITLVAFLLFGGLLALTGINRFYTIATSPPGDVCAYNTDCDGVCENCQVAHTKSIFGGAHDPSSCSSNNPGTGCSSTYNQLCSDAASGPDYCSDWEGVDSSSWVCYDLGSAECIDSIDVSFGPTTGNTFDVSTCTGGCTSGCTVRLSNQASAGSSTCGTASATCAYTTYTLSSDISARYVRIDLDGALDISEILVNAGGDCGTCTATAVCDSTGCSSPSYCDGTEGVCVSPDTNSVAAQRVCEAGCTGLGSGNHTQGSTFDGWESGTSSSCCGDDAGEYYRFGVSTPYACCDTVTDCVETIAASAQCTADGIPATEVAAFICNSGDWLECAGGTACSTKGSYTCVYQNSGSYDWINPVPAESACTDNYDNDCDGDADYDGDVDDDGYDVGETGDSTCPVSVSDINISKDDPCISSGIEVNCTMNVANINSALATVNGNSCSLDSWDGSVAKFICTVPASEGTYDVNCTVNSTISTQSGPDQSTPITVGNSNCCNTYGTQVLCSADTSCNWVPQTYDSSMDAPVGPSDGACCSLASYCSDGAEPGGACYITADEHDPDADGDSDYCQGGIWYDCSIQDQCQFLAGCEANDCIGEWISLEPVVPIGFTNYDSEYTGTTSVIINTGWKDGAESCRYINGDNTTDAPDPNDVYWTPWESCTVDRYWLLSDDEGEKVVYGEINYTTYSVVMNDTIYYNATGCGLDNTAPSTFTINDGIYTNNNNTIRITWTAAEDPEQELLNIPLVYDYEVWHNETGTQVMLDAGTTAQLEFTTTGHETVLAHNYTVFVTINARNCAGRTQSVVSDGLKIDLEPPLAPSINGKQFYNLTSTSWQALVDDVWHHTRQLYFNWTSFDVESGIYGYSYSLTTDPFEEPDDIPEGSLGSFASELENTFTSIPSGDYYFSVKARDGAGNWGPSNQYHVLVDNTPASKPEIQNQDIDVVAKRITYDWDASEDDESGIVYYMLNISNNGPYDPNVSYIINDTSHMYNISGTADFNTTLGVMNGAGIWRWDFQDAIQTDFDPPQIIAKPQGRIVSLDPVISVWTNEKAECTYNWTDGMRTFIYTNTTYHEDQRSVSDSETYHVDVTCVDTAGNSATETITFIVDATRSVSQINVSASQAAYVGQQATIQLNLSDASDLLGEVAKERINFQIDDEDTYYSLVDKGQGYYEIHYRAPLSAGVRSINLTVDDKEVPILLANQELSLHLVYTDTIDQPDDLDYIVYGTDGNTMTGIATDSDIRSMHAAASYMNVSAQAQDNIYIFNSRYSSNLRFNQNYFANDNFLDLINPSFGYDIMNKYVIRFILDYDERASIEGDQVYNPGYYNYLLTNRNEGSGVSRILIEESQSDNTRTVVQDE